MIRKKEWLLTVIICVFFAGIFAMTEIEASEIRIGVELMPSVEKTPSYVLYHNISHLEKLSGITFVWNDTTYESTPESSIYFAERMIDKGVDGIILSPSSDQVLPAIARLCEENNVYWGICFKDIQDEKVRKICEANEYYIGNTYENEVQAGYDLTNTVLELGYRKFALFSETKWNVTTALREQSFYELMREYEDAEVVAEVREMRSLSDVEENTRAVLMANPELDCIYLAGTKTIGAASRIIKIIEEMGLQGQVYLATFDFSETPSKDYETGILVATYGLPQLFIDPYYLSIKMINHLKGYPLDDTGTSNYVEGILVSDQEAVLSCQNVIENRDLLFFSDDYVSKKLFKWNNPELNTEMFQEIINSNRFLELSTEEES